MQRLNQRTSCVATDDFFNTIGHKPTYAVQNGMSALPPKATLNAFIRMSASHAENLLWIFLRLKRILAHVTISFDEGLKFIGAHAFRANVGLRDLYILRDELGNYAHEIDGMRPRRCHQRWLAESLPRITEITEEVLGQFTA